VPVRLSRNVVPDMQVVVVDAEAPEGVEAAADLLLKSLLVVMEVLPPVATVEDTDEDAAEASAVDLETEGASEPGDSTPDEEAAATESEEEAPTS